MKISLITTTFNSEKHLSDTFNSVLKQSFQDIEYIVIDGASTDSTLDIIKAFQDRFAGRMTYISEPDNGLYDALNKGIRMASGDIVGILNSDDFFTSNDVLTKIVNKFECSECDAVYGDVHYVNPSDLNKSIRYYSSSIFKRSLMRIGFMPAHPTFYAYKSLFEKYGYYKTNYKIAADFELLLRFIYVNKIKIAYLPFDCVTMRTGGMSTESFSSRKTIMKEHIKAFKENSIFTNRLILSLRYPYKILELIKVRFKN